MVNEQEKKQIERKASWNIRPYLAIGLTALLVIVVSISVFFFMYRYDAVSSFVGNILSILQPVIIGLVLAYLMTPIVNFEERFLVPIFENKMKNKKKAGKLVRGLSVMGALVFVLVIIAVLLQMVVPELYSSINGLITSLPRQVNEFMDWLNDYISSESEISGYLEMALKSGTEYFENWAKTDLLPQSKTIMTGLTSGVISVGRMLLNIVVGIIISIYVLLSKETFIGQSKKVIYALFPAKAANAIINTVHKSNEIFGGFISGKILDSFIIGILCFICISLLGMPYTVLVSVIVGVTNVIPFFGPYLGAIPSTILILLADPMQGLYFVIFILVLQQIDGNIIGPKILGDSTGLSPFWVVFAILVGGGLFGILGMIIGVPTFAVIYYIIRNVIDFILQKKKLPKGSKNYIPAERLDIETNTLIYAKQREEGMEEPKEGDTGKKE